jgi:transposase
MVTVRVPGQARKGGRAQETREFGTVRRQLLELADWLRSHGVERAGMEAASDYRKPVYFLLEQQGLDCVLYKAAQVKALPGRPKTDKLDSVWLAEITGRGSLAGSFVPPEDIRRLRTRTRCRRKLTQARTAEKQRAEKLPEDAHLKLSSVISDVHGVSGQDMPRAAVAGERNPRVLAEMARGRMRRKTARLVEAPDCPFFTEEHAFVLAMMLENIDHYSAQIAALDEKIAVLCEPYTRQLAQLDAIPGFGATNAQDLIGEIGVDMTVFPTAGHLCSWARVAPRPKESGGRRKGNSASGKGSPYTGATLGEAAVTAGPAQTFLGARLRRLCRHMPEKKAQGAVMRTQLCIARALLSDPEAAYRELGPGYYDQQAGTQRQARGHIRSLERLGCKVTIEPIDPDTGELTAKAG